MRSPIPERRRKLPFMERLRNALPQGRTLPEESWRKRHLGIVYVLWTHALGLGVFGLVMGHGIVRSAGVAASIAAIALLAQTLRHRRRWRAVIATLGLLTSSGILVYLSGGYIEMHFHYFVMVSLLMLYEDWIPFLIALLYVVAQHGLLGVLSPHHVYNHPGAVSDPWLWAGIHGVFILAASAVNLVNWRLNEDAEAAQQAFLKNVIDVNPNMIFVKDPVGRYVLANQALADLYDTTVQAVLGRTDADFHADPEEVESFLRADREVMVDGRRKFIRLQRVTDAKTGETRWFQTTKVPLASSDGGPSHVLGVATDVTEFKRAEEALRESEERYALVARGANDGFWDWNVRGGSVYFSPRWKSMIGYEAHEVGTDPEEWLGRLHAEDADKVRAVLDAHLAGRTAAREIEYRIRHKDGSYRWMLSRGLAVGDPEGQIVRMAGSQTDITNRKVAEKQLVHDALHDALTGLPNRALMVERIWGALGRARRRGGSAFAVLCLDVDRFKLVNDGLGHTAGDQLLSAIARRLESCLRPGDTVARLEGDEFAVLLEDIQKASEATDVATRIQQELSKVFRLGNREVFTSASIGVLVGAAEYDRPEELLRDADLAMVRAKSQGKARHEVFDTTMRTRAVARLHLDTDLRRAVERNELRVQYQPIVCVDTEEITGFEALVRWEHPNSGVVSPAEFIPVAEETGLVAPIGAWVLREACRQTATWHAQFPSDQPVTISVNVSSKQFLESHLVEQIAEVLEDTGLEPSALRLEITETAMVESPESATAMLSQLREMGVQVYVDDFGTGYSGLSYLQRFPLDGLKIDRSFTSRITGGGENLDIVRAILALARDLGIDVVAEGVESQQQLTHLKEVGCRRAQGFFFARPLDGASATRLIARKRQAIGIAAV